MWPTILKKGLPKYLTRSVLSVSLTSNLSVGDNGHGYDICDLPKIALELYGMKVLHLTVDSSRVFLHCNAPKPVGSYLGCITI